MYQQEAVLFKRQVISPHPHNTSSYDNKNNKNK